MNTTTRFISVSVLFLSIVACGGGGGGTASTAPAAAGPATTGPPATTASPSTATVTVLLTDAPGPSWDQALATVTSVALIGAAGQQTIFSGRKTVDLLSLADFFDVFAIAGDVPPATINKIRLVVEQLVLVDLDAKGAVVRRVPARLVGGGKIDLDPQGSFALAAGDTVFISIDFDMNKAFKTSETGNGDVIVRPVVRIKVTHTAPEGRLVRLHGSIRSIDDDAKSFVLCQSTPIATPHTSKDHGDGENGRGDANRGDGDHGDDDEDDNDDGDNADGDNADGDNEGDAAAERGCVDVETDELTGLFGADGAPAAFLDLEVADEVTAIGRLARDDSNDSEAAHPTPLSKNERFHDDLVLHAVTVEVGDAWRRVAGTAATGVTNDAFDLAIGPSQNLGTDARVLSTQLSPKTRIFDRAGKELARDAIATGVAVLADGVLQAAPAPTPTPTPQAAPAGTLRTALLVLDPAAADEEKVLRGEIVSVNFDAGTFRMLVDTAEKCVDARVADIFLVSNDNGLLTERGSLADLEPGQHADAFGDAFGADGCLIASDVLVDAAPGNTAPVANAGADRKVVAGASVMLDGTASKDDDGDTLTYRWRFVSTPGSSTATLSAPTTATPSFTTDKPGVYVAELIVNDGIADSAPDLTIVEATPTP